MSYLSYCGILCDECPIYIATKNNDIEARKKLAIECSNDNNVFDVVDIYCEGCFMQSNDNSKMCGDCKVRACAKVAAVKNCAECKKYPCDIAEEFIPKDSDMRERLDQIFSTIDKE